MRKGEEKEPQQFPHHRPQNNLKNLIELHYLVNNQLLFGSSYIYMGPSLQGPIKLASLITFQQLYRESPASESPGADSQ